MWLDDDDKEFNNDKETLHLQKTNLAMLIPSCLFKEKICFIRRKTFSFTTVHILVKSVVGVPSRKIENITSSHKVLEELHLMIKEIKLYVLILHFIMTKFFKS